MPERGFLDCGNIQAEIVGRGRSDKASEPCMRRLRLKKKQAKQMGAAAVNVTLSNASCTQTYPPNHCCCRSRHLANLSCSYK